MKCLGNGIIFHFFGYLCDIKITLLGVLGLVFFPGLSFCVLQIPAYVIYYFVILSPCSMKIINTWKEFDSLLLLRCGSVDETWFTVDVNVFVWLVGTVGNFAELPVEGSFPPVDEEYTAVLPCVDPWGWAVGELVVVVVGRSFVAVTREREDSPLISQNHIQFMENQIHDDIW